LLLDEKSTPPKKSITFENVDFEKSNDENYANFEKPNDENYSNSENGAKFEHLNDENVFDENNPLSPDFGRASRSLDRDSRQGSNPGGRSSNQKRSRQGISVTPFFSMDGS